MTLTLVRHAWHAICNMAGMSTAPRNSELAARYAAADTDLAMVRRYAKRPIAKGVGEMVIGIGRVEKPLLLSYNSATKSYKLVQCGAQPVELAKGTPREVRAILAPLYVVDAA